MRVSTAGSNRVASLDVLRGVAILLVLFRHSFIEPRFAGAFEPIATLLYHFGWTGVDLFFVLSGFLVGGLLIREFQRRGSIDARRFLIRRAFKIWPSYYLFLIVAYAFQHVWKQPHPPWEIRYYAIHLQNYLAATPGHLWSLAVEEHFYLALPVLLAILARKKATHYLPTTTFAVLAIGLLLRGLTRVFVPNYSHEIHSFPTHLRIDSLLVGVCTAYFYYVQPERLQWVYARRWLAAIGGVVLLLPMLFLGLETSRFVPLAGFPLLAIGYALILLSITPAPEKGAKGFRIFQTVPLRLLSLIGFYSYPIYLWHLHLAEPAAKYVLTLLPIASLSVKWVVAMISYVFFSLLFGLALGRAVELPALRVRDRLFPAVASGTG